MRKHLLILLISLFTTCIAFAQVTTSSMSGVVVDEKGQTVPGATVIAVHNPTGTVYSTATRADGRFNLANIRIGGPYTIKIKFLGYNEFVQENIVLALGEDYKFKTKLLPSSNTLAEVKVTGLQDKVINNSRTGEVTTVTRSQIDALPSVSRSIFDYTKLEPSSNGRSFGGRNDSYNNITVDGALFNNSFGLSSTLGGQTNSQPISLDAVEQIQVAVSPFDVTQGRFAGSGVNVVTKSGTNEVKGTAYYYFRNSNLVGVKAGNVTLATPPVNYHQSGLSLGAPIIKNKLFLFFSGEQERQSDPATTYTALQAGQTAGGTISQAPADSLIKLSNFLKSKYGYDPGPYENYQLRTQSDKITVKLDWNINDKNSLSIKYFYLKSLRDINGSSSGAPSPGRAPGSFTMPFFSSYYTINNNFNNVIAELNTRFSSTLANKLTIGYQALRDFRSSPGSGQFPLVDIQSGSSTSNNFTSFGYEPFTANNLLNTDTYQFSDNLTIYKGNHEISLGGSAELDQFKNGFAPNYYGLYRFNSLNDFINSANNGLPLATLYSYRYSALPDGSFPYAALKAYTLGFYAQDKWQMSDRLRLTYGVRLDVPFYSVQTQANPSVLGLTGFRNGVQLDVSQFPSTAIQISPRFGFNWDVKGDATTQIRGGVGLFTGPTPYVWISNQASNNGVQFGSYTLTPTANPGDSRLAFNPNVNANRPVPGTAAANVSYNLAVTNNNFKNPKNLRIDAAIDQKLPMGITGTLEFNYSKDINGVYMQNVALPLTGTPLVGSDNRIRYSNTTVYPSGGNTATNPNISDAELMSNTSNGYTYNITAQLQKSIKDFNFTLGYTHGDSRSVNDGGSIAQSIWSGRQVSGDPNADVSSYSAFYQPDRIVASASYRKTYAKNFATSFGFTFESQTAGVTSYTYSGDLNNDNVTFNDLIYIPKDINDIVLVKDNAADPRSTAQIWAQLNNYINQDPYLYKRRGQYAERNGLVLPNYQVVDFNFTQDFFIKSGKVKNTLEFTFNIINLGNFLNRNWGNVKFVNRSSLLSYKGLVTTAGDPNLGKPTFSFPYLDNTNQIPLTDTFGNGTSQLSRSQAQIGVRYIFN